MKTLCVCMIVLLLAGLSLGNEWCELDNTVTSSPLLYFDETTANHLGMNTTSANITIMRLNNGAKFTKSVNIMNWMPNTIYIRLNDLNTTAPAILTHGPSHIIGPSTHSLQLSAEELSGGFYGMSAYMNDGGTSPTLFSVYGR